MTDLQAQLRELISKKLAELSSIDFSKNAPYSDREEALKAIVILTDCVCKLETTRGKVIYNYRGNSGRSLDVATPVTAHHRAELPPFRSVENLTQQLHGTAVDENIAWKYYDLCREHEQRIKRKGIWSEVIRRNYILTEYLFDTGSATSVMDRWTKLHEIGLLDKDGKLKI